MQLCVLTRVPYGEHDITNMYRLPNAHESLVTSSLVVGAITMGAGMHADPHTGQRQLASQSPRCVRHSTCAANTNRRYQSHLKFALHAMLPWAHYPLCRRTSSRSTCSSSIQASSCCALRHARKLRQRMPTAVMMSMTHVFVDSGAFPEGIYSKRHMFTSVHESVVTRLDLVT